MPNTAKIGFSGGKNSVVARNQGKAKNLEKSTLFRAESQSYSTLGSLLKEIIFKLKNK